MFIKIVGNYGNWIVAAVHWICIGCVFHTLHTHTIHTHSHTSIKCCVTFMQSVWNIYTDFNNDVVSFLDSWSSLRSLRDSQGSMAPKDIMTNSHAKSILNAMNSLRKSNTLCDITLRVENTDFPAHRIVLAACSDYFCAMFTSEVTLQMFIYWDVNAKKNHYGFCVFVSCIKIIGYV